MRRIKFGELKNAWASRLTEWPFEWWATLTFKFSVNQEIGRKRLINWTREICTEEQLQLAYMAVFNELRRGHWHVLMLGRNRQGKSLRDVSREKWQERWRDNALIQEIYDLAGISRYFSHNLVLENADLSGVFSYNRKLLNKCKI